jgi:TPR repeat protein
LFQLSANQGSDLGQINLAGMYENGRGGLPVNIEEAIALYRKSAAQGNERAKSHLKRLGKS